MTLLQSLHTFHPKHTEAQTAYSQWVFSCFKPVAEDPSGEKNTAIVESLNYYESESQLNTLNKILPFERGDNEVQYM